MAFEDLHEAIIAEDAGELLSPPPTISISDAGGRTPTVWWSDKKGLYEILASVEQKDDGRCEYCIYETIECS